MVQMICMLLAILHRKKNHENKTTRHSYENRKLAATSIVCNCTQCVYLYLYNKNTTQVFILVMDFFFFTKFLNTFRTLSDSSNK